MGVLKKEGERELLLCLLCGEFSDVAQLHMMFVLAEIVGPKAQ